MAGEPDEMFEDIDRWLNRENAKPGDETLVKGLQFLGGQVVVLREVFKLLLEQQPTEFLTNLRESLRRGGTVLTEEDVEIQAKFPAFSAGYQTMRDYLLAVIDGILKAR